MFKTSGGNSTKGSEKLGQSGYCTAILLISVPKYENFRQFLAHHDIIFDARVNIFILQYQNTILILIVMFLWERKAVVISMTLKRLHVASACMHILLGNCGISPI